MKYGFYFCLFILLLIILGISCKKRNECETVPEVPKDYLDYWFFPVGSFWVYQLEDSSSAIDTLTVTYVEVSISPKDMIDDGKDYIGGYRVACRKHHSIALTHSSLLFSSSNTGQGTEIYFSTIQSEDINDYYLNGSDGCGPEYVFLRKLVHFPFSVGEQIPDGAHFIDTNAVVTPLQTFNNVIHIIEPHGKPYKKHYYFSKKVGLVKTICPDSTVWILINYQIK